MFRFKWARAIEMHIFKQYYGVRQYFMVYRFVSERKRQVVIEQTRLLSTVFLCSEFKLENIYAGVNFGGKNVAGTYFCGSLKKKNAKIAKIRTRKNFVPHGRPFPSYLSLRTSVSAKLLIWKFIFTKKVLHLSSFWKWGFICGARKWPISIESQPLSKLRYRRIFRVGESLLFMIVLLRPPSLILWQRKIGESRDSNP